MPSEEVDQGEDQQSQQPSPIGQVVEELDADLFLYSGSLYRKEVAQLLDGIESGRCRRNVGLFLTTHGGDADAAYILVRRLRDWYERLTLYVFGLCKSAGTLVALGAHEIVLSDRGELGPLDVQLVKEDELAALFSGLDVYTTMNTIRDQAFAFFENYFLEILAKSGGRITTKTAADIATMLSIGLLSPFASQIDPMRLGETFRAMNVGRAYGMRLTDNHPAVEWLTSSYPSHSFVIDHKEARELFRNVRQPTVSELGLELALRQGLVAKMGHECIRVPSPDDLILSLSLEKEETEDVPEHGIQEQGENTSAVPEGSEGHS